MTLLATHRDPMRRRVVYVVNECHETQISDREMRDADDEDLDRDAIRRAISPKRFPLGSALDELVTRRIAPLVWLAMPCHEYDLWG